MKTPNSDTRPDSGATPADDGLPDSGATPAEDGLPGLGATPADEGLPGSGATPTEEWPSTLEAADSRISPEEAWMFNLEAGPLQERLPTPEEAAAIAKIVKARIKRRTARYCDMEDLYCAAFSFSFFPHLPEIDYEQEAEQILWDAWEETGDFLRLAMMEWSMGEHDDAACEHAALAPDATPTTRR